MAKIEDRLRALENQKRPRSADTDQQSDQYTDQHSDQYSNQYSNQHTSQQSNQQPEHTMDPPTLGHYTVICPSIEQDDSESSSLDTIKYYYKR